MADQTYWSGLPVEDPEVALDTGPVPFGADVMGISRVFACTGMPPAVAGP